MEHLAEQSSHQRRRRKWPVLILAAVALLLSLPFLMPTRKHDPRFVGEWIADYKLSNVRPFVWSMSEDGSFTTYDLGPPISHGPELRWWTSDGWLVIDVNRNLGWKGQLKDLWNKARSKRGLESWRIESIDESRILLSMPRIRTANGMESIVYSPAELVRRSPGTKGINGQPPSAE